MIMATTEEKQELVENLKGPRYYRIMLQGYGGESAYMSVSKEAHDFWNAQCDESGDCDLVSYMVSDDDDEPDFEYIESVPPEAQFLHDTEENGYKRPWFESHTEFEHSYGVEYGSANLSVDEVDSGDYSANDIAEVFSYQSLSELHDQLAEETDYEHEMVKMDEAYDVPEGTEYIAQMYSSEKGCFYEGVIETIGDFDPKKLKVYTLEYLNGEDTVTSIEYDGVEVDNDGGDTNGKGYSAHVGAS